MVVGFYFVMWGKAKEEKTIDKEPEERFESDDNRAPLLHNNNHDGVISA